MPAHACEEAEAFLLPLSMLMPRRLHVPSTCFVFWRAVQSVLELQAKKNRFGWLFGFTLGRSEVPDVAFPLSLWGSLGRNENMLLAQDTRAGAGMRQSSPFGSFADARSTCAWSDLPFCDLCVGRRCGTALPQRLRGRGRGRGRSPRARRRVAGRRSGLVAVAMGQRLTSLQASTSTRTTGAATITSTTTAARPAPPPLTTPTEETILKQEARPWEGKIVVKPAVRPARVCRLPRHHRGRDRHQQQ